MIRHNILGNHDQYFLPASRIVTFKFGFSHEMIKVILFLSYLYRYSLSHHTFVLIFLKFLLMGFEKNTQKRKEKMVLDLQVVIYKLRK